jgi:hypothetical protein
MCDGDSVCPYTRRRAYGLTVESLAMSVRMGERLASEPPMYLIEIRSQARSKRSVLVCNGSC